MSEKIPIAAAERIEQEWLKYRNTLPESTDNSLEEIFEEWLSKRLNKFKRTCKIKIRMEQTLQEVKEEMGICETKPTNTYFVTISPKDINIQDFITAIDVLLQYKWIVKACGCIEQRGTTEETMGQGTHFHCLVQVALGVGRGTIPKKVVSAFNSLNLIIREPSVDVSQPCKRAIDITNRINYMTDGKATDEEKKDKFCMDEPYRKKENIPRWFLKNSDEFWGENL